MLFLDFWLTPIAKSSWVYISLWQRFRWYAQWGRINFSIFSNKRKNVTVCYRMLQNSWILIVQRLDARGASVGRRDRRVSKWVALEYSKDSNERICTNWKWNASGFLQVLGRQVLKIRGCISLKNPRFAVWARVTNGVVELETWPCDRRCEH